jgi:hypothetical protein
MKKVKKETKQERTQLEHDRQEYTADNRKFLAFYFSFFLSFMLCLCSLFLYFFISFCLLSQNNTIDFFLFVWLSFLYAN